MLLPWADVLFTCLAGRSRAEFKVSKSDPPEIIQEQWQGILKMLHGSNSALLHHMENHYCLVFAARSWHIDAGQTLSLTKSSIMFQTSTLLKACI